MLIIDGDNFLHRCLMTEHYYTMEHNGMPTGGIFGFLQTTQKIIKTIPQSYKIIAVFDGKRSQRRKDYFPEYKENRKPKNEQDAIAKENYFKIFNPQKQILKDEVLTSLGILPITCSSREGDDVIYQICNIFADTDIVIATEDKDLLQLIHHYKKVKIYRPIADEVVNYENFSNTKGSDGVPVELFLLYKAILGDKSDNISGISGVGEVTIKKILEKCDKNNPEETILSYVKSIYDEDIKKDKISKIGSVFKNWGVIARNLELIDLSREPFSASEVYDLKNSINNFECKMYSEYFKSICFKYGFNSVLDNFDFWIRTFSRNFSL